MRRRAVDRKKHERGRCKSDGGRSGRACGYGVAPPYKRVPPTYLGEVSGRNVVVPEHPQAVPHDDDPLSRCVIVEVEWLQLQRRLVARHVGAATPMELHVRRERVRRIVDNREWREWSAGPGTLRCVKNTHLVASAAAAAAAIAAAAAAIAAAAATVATAASLAAVPVAQERDRKIIRREPYRARA